MNRLLMQAAAALRWVDVIEYLAKILLLIAKAIAKKEPQEPKEL